MSIEKIIPIDKELVNIFGVNDQNLKYLKDKFKKINVGDKGYFYFSNGKQCMYSKSPCTYYIPQNLKHQKVFTYDIYWIEA